MFLCKFGEIPSNGSKDIVSDRSYADVDADADRTRTQNNMSPTLGWADIKNHYKLNLFLTIKNLFCKVFATKYCCLTKGPGRK